MPAFQSPFDYILTKGRDAEEDVAKALSAAEWLRDRSNETDALWRRRVDTDMSLYRAVVSWVADVYFDSDAAIWCEARTTIACEYGRLLVESHQLDYLLLYFAALKRGFKRLYTLLEEDLDEDLSIRDCDRLANTFSHILERVWLVICTACQLHCEY